MVLTFHALDNQDLFPMNWVLTDAVQAVVRVSPLGICLLQAVRPSTPDTPNERTHQESITDFRYLAVNDVMQAMLSLPVEDILHRTLRFLGHDSKTPDLIRRLAQTARTGQPGQSVETYQLDGVIGTYHQLYVKSDEGVLMLIQDVTYTPLSSQEEAANNRLLQAIESRVSAAEARTLLLELISGQIT
jgi:PAS domain-containing protein